MLSTFASLSVNSAKHLAAHRARSFAEFTLERSEGRRRDNTLPILVVKIPYRSTCRRQAPAVHYAAHNGFLMLSPYTRFREDEGQLVAEGVDEALRHEDELVKGIDQAALSLV